MDKGKGFPKRTEECIDGSHLDIRGSGIEIQLFPNIFQDFWDEGTL